MLFEAGRTCDVGADSGQTARRQAREAVPRAGVTLCDWVNRQRRCLVRTVDAVTSNTRADSLYFLISHPRYCRLVAGVEYY